MGQRMLNTVAVIIFLTTMATLFGPLINLSQGIPIAAIAAILSIATLDQVVWDGTLGNLLTGSLIKFSEEEQQRVLHHEAGHFLVAHLLDIPVTDYTLSAWEAWRKGFPGQGGVQFDTLTLEATLKTGQMPAQLLNRYCTVWMAGIAAEKQVFGEAQGGQDDRQKFSILWQQLQRPIQEGQMRQRWAILQAQSLLEKHSDAYQALVTAMADGQPVEDCRSLLTAHCPAGSAVA